MLLIQNDLRSADILQSLVRTAEQQAANAAQSPVDAGTAPESGGVEIPQDPSLLELASSLQQLAMDDNLWRDAMSRAFGDLLDPAVSNAVRQRLASGEAGELFAASAAGNAQEAATVMLREMGLPAESPELQDALAAEIDPARHGKLEHYLRQPPANESTTPQLLNFGELAYGSTEVNLAASRGDVILDGIRHEYVAAIIPTPPVAMEMDQAGIANTLNPEWQAMVAEAARRNGGLGDSEDGFLAFSSEHGFVRLRNPGLTPEQNRRLAEMSLTMGVSVDVLPSRTAESSTSTPHVNHWVNEIIGRFDTEVADFMVDPQRNGISVSDGRRKLHLEFNEKAGRFVSYDFKRSGGFRGVAQRHLGDIAPVLDALAIAVNVIPGIGQAASIAIAAGSQTLKAGLTYAVTGDISAQQIASIVTSAIPGGGALSATQAAALRGVVTATGQYVDTGDFDAGALVRSMAPAVFKGIDGLDKLDASSQSALIGVLSAAADGKFDAKDALKLARLIDKELGFTDKIKDEANDLFDSIFGDLGEPSSIAGSLMMKETGEFDVQDVIGSAGRILWSAISEGDVRAKDIVGAIGGYLSERVSEDATEQEDFLDGLKSLAKWIDGGRTDTEELARAMAPLLAMALGLPEPAETA